MCGIAGIISKYDTEQSLYEHAQVMLDVIKRRGPDQSSIWQNEHAAMVHSRLAIISPDTGHQPLHSFNQRYTIVYNGEIYNYKTLRNELKTDWEFQTESDTEVVLAAFVVWGEKALLRFNGMFAFFIWDAEHKVGFCARDLMGIKPFCYYAKDELFLFASDARAILPIINKPSLNEQYIWQYWACPAFSCFRETPFMDIHHLPPGHAMWVNTKDNRLFCWKNYQVQCEYFEETPEFYPLLDKALTNACTSALISDVPITSYLSGGLDSSLITSIAAKQSSQFKESYSIQFKSQHAFDYKNSLIVKEDDFPYAQELADFAQIKLNPVVVHEDEMISAFQTLAHINYQIPAWEQEFTHLFLAKEVAKKYKVTLVGDVADETHYGYHYMLDDKARRSPREIMNRFANAPLALSNTENEALMMSIYDRVCKEANSAGHDWKDEMSQYVATSYLIIKFWLPRLLLNADIYPMYYGVEARVPFADIYLLDLASRISPQLAMKNNIEKYCLKQVARNKIPESIRNRLKSSLPKNQCIGKMYQSEMKKILRDPQVEDLVGQYLHWPSVKQLIFTHDVLTEKERALLFKVISFYYWFLCHQ